MTKDADATHGYNVAAGLMNWHHFHFKNDSEKQMSHPGAQVRVSFVKHGGPYAAYICSNPPGYILYNDKPYGRVQQEELA